MPLPHPSLSSRHASINNIGLFKGIPEPHISRLHEIFTLRPYAPRQSIYTPEESTDKIYILIEGSAVIYQYSNLKRIIIHMLGKGDVFGDAYITPHGTTNWEDAGSYAEAKSAAIVAVASKRDWMRVLEQSPMLSLRIINELSRRLNDAEVKIRDLALNDIKVRVINEMVRLSRENGRKAGDVYVLKQHLTHEELSQLVGASREAVTRGIGELRAQGVLTKSRGEYRIQNNKLGLGDYHV